MERTEDHRLALLRTELSCNPGVADAQLALHLRIVRDARDRTDRTKRIASSFAAGAFAHSGPVIVSVCSSRVCPVNLAGDGGQDGSGCHRLLIARARLLAAAVIAPVADVRRSAPRSDDDPVGPRRCGATLPHDLDVTAAFVTIVGIGWLAGPATSIGHTWAFLAFRCRSRSSSLCGR